MLMVSERIAEVQKGVAYTTFTRLAKRVGVSEERLRTVLGFSASTLYRRKVAGRFTLDESNRIYWLERLPGFPDQVPEDPEKTKTFITTRNPAPGGAVPLDYGRTAPGLEAVRRLLLQLDHGVIV